MAKPTFNDIGASPYQTQIEMMAAHGFLKGYQGLSGPYGPTDNVLRDQMAVIITRMANRTNGWNQETPPNNFIDQCNADGCAEPELWNAVAVGFEKNVIFGVGGGRFAPFDPVTEIQVVAFTSRAMIAITHELEERGRYPACPDASIPAPPLATVSPCATRIVSPGTTGLRNLHLSTVENSTLDGRASGPKAPSVTRQPAVCAIPSMINTPGKIGRPGKWPVNCGSLIVTFFNPTPYSAPRISTMRSTSRKG